MRVLPESHTNQKKSLYAFPKRPRLLHIYCNKRQQVEPLFAVVLSEYPCIPELLLRASLTGIFILFLYPLCARVFAANEAFGGCLQATLAFISVAVDCTLTHIMNTSKQKYWALVWILRLIVCVYESHI